ncbi:MAG TPA: neutral zinc metallopeptidase [Candidatus Binatia bacterium]|nr:neutral zinc metallopeptidase [Candidatus Binatia bacterium]
MRWRLGTRSDNVVDRRGIGAGGLSGLGVLIVVVISWFLGVDPRQMLGLAEQVTAPGSQEAHAPPANDEQADFVRAILGETEAVWSALVQGYAPPRLVLFSGAVRSGCGRASSASGPFYCPEDRQVYLDLSFFDEMKQRLGGGGDFAYAYVIAHEVGHHVQKLTGTSDRLDRMRASGTDLQGDAGPLVRLELQADCYAGVWGFHAQRRHQWLETGDVEAALNTASAIGDDRLQRQAHGQVVPDSFTHGTSEQRARWFRKGFSSGDPGSCDTFGSARL